MTTQTQLSDFIAGYVECALASSADTRPGEDYPRPLDDDFGEDDIAPDTLHKMYSDCADFIASNYLDLDEACRIGWPSYTYNSAGHDFWLTRCGHGAGFWDRGLGEVGERLTDAAVVYRGIDLYSGDDGKVHA